MIRKLTDEEQKSICRLERLANYFEQLGRKKMQRALADRRRIYVIDLNVTKMKPCFTTVKMKHSDIFSIKKQCSGSSRRSRLNIEENYRNSGV